MTLLQYAFLTEPAVLQAGTPARLTLSVSNGGHTRATCSSITVRLPVGTNAKDLIATAGGIGTVNAPNWTAAIDGGIITLTPTTPAAGLIGSQGLAFIITGLDINAQPGVCTVEIGETATNSTAPPVARTTTLPLNKFPAHFALTGPTANEPGVAGGGSATIMWTGSPASYTLSYDPDGNGVQDFPVENVGPYTTGPLTNAAGVDFTLTVEVDVPGADQPMTLQPQVHVDVSNPTPTITTFTAAFSGTFGSDVGATLTWATSGRDVECAMSGNFQLLAPSGTLPVTPNGTTTSSYTLSASNVNGTTMSTITIDWARAATTLALADAPVNLALSPDGKTAYVACKNSLYAVDLAALSVSAVLPWSNLLTVNVVPGGKELVITDGSQVVVLDAATLKTLPYNGAHWGVGLASQAPYPTSAALSGDGTCCYPPGPGNVAMYEVGPPPRLSNSFLATPSVPLAIVLSPDGKSAVVAGPGSAALDDVASGSQLHALNTPANATFTGAAFHPNGTIVYVLASSASDGTKTITALDTATFRTLGSMTYGAGTPAWCGGIAVTPDGSFVLCGGLGVVMIMHGSSHETLGMLPAIDGAATTDIRMPPDGSAAVVCSCDAQQLAIVPLPSITGGINPSASFVQVTA